MAFLTPAQIIILRDLRRRQREASRALAAACKAFSGDKLHSQACDIGGMYTGGCNGLSGESPCPCGGDSDRPMTLGEAYAKESHNHADLTNPIRYWIGEQEGAPR